MRYIAKRIYPVTYRKKNTAPQKSMDFSLGAAAGILAFTFAAGFFLGICRKKMY